MQTNNNFHILVVDDEKLNIELASIYLKEEGYKISFALNALGAIESVKKFEIDLILLDINMPQTDGFEVCEMLKDDNSTKDIPVIFLTAQTDITYISKAFEVGGADYISKPFNSIELKARVRTQLQNVSYLQEIKDKQTKLAQLSITDSLTKLHNALYFDSQIKIKQKSGKKFWFLYLKIDRFDKLNEVYGFYGANRILKIFSKILEETSFSNSLVARLYGASFGVQVKGYDKKVIKGLYEKIALHLLNDKDLGKLISFDMVAYSIKDKELQVPQIYKNVQKGIQKLKKSNENSFAFI